MKGQLWISAVLYIALGVVIITLILAAGLPLIDKMRDRNTIVQTKTLMLQIDDNIRTVAHEGPGSKRFLSPVDIGEGELVVNDEAEQISWSIITNNKMMEPGIEFQEGFLNYTLEETPVEKEYKITLKLDYLDIADIKLDPNNPYGNPFVGTYSLTIEIYLKRKWWRR